MMPSDSQHAEFWPSRRVLVTGGSGFLGSHLLERLAAQEPAEIIAPGVEDYDLTEVAAVRAMFREHRPDTVIHLAALVGGIGANRDNPGRFFYANIAMGIHMIEEARISGVDRYVQLGTICAYPKHTPVPFRETDLWNGYPEETNAPYGIAKKALLVQLQAYRAQYGFSGVYLLPVNLYGPHDNFDPATSHVIPALIRKMVEAREAGADEVVLWGTGAASREFLYVDDCARATLLAAERYDEADPVNVGTGEEITVWDLAVLIAGIVGFEGRLTTDPSKPDGQPRRCLDTSQAEERFGFRAEVSLREGLMRTVNWYLGASESDGSAAGTPEISSGARNDIE